MRSLMLVSAFVGADLRNEVVSRKRPQPEFLSLEQRYGVTLLDWSAVAERGGTRSVARSARHALCAYRRLRGVDVVLSDGEHVAIPLSTLMSLSPTAVAHVAIAHNLLTPSKLRAMRMLKASRHLDRVLVHSPNQVSLLAEQLPALRPRLRVVPYGIDTTFWSTPPASDHGEAADLVVSAGREHRDYDTLLAARPKDAQLFIADHSFHSPGAQRNVPDGWPTGVEHGALSPAELRERYRKAAIVVVPVIETPFPAGITTLLEAMSMGKAVVVSGTAGLEGIVEDGRTGLVVPPGDSSALRCAMTDLLADPARRSKLGEAARYEAVSRFGLEAYVDALAAQLREVS